MSIALITPLRDESTNIDPLFEAIASQTVPIDYWLILENNSTDGSREYLSEIEKPPNVKQLVILNLDLEGGYRLGFKYSAIIREGMDHMSRHFPDFEFIGILDADCTPEERYYETLLDYFSKNSDTGILSGKLYEGNAANFDPGFPRGNCRLWRRSCFLEVGYRVGMSADSISATMARLKGWQTTAIDTTIVRSRKVSQRVSKAYTGKANYYNGIRLNYAFLKFLMFFARLKPVDAVQYLYGYLLSMITRAEKIDEPEIRKFYERYLWYKVKAFWKRKANL